MNPRRELLWRLELFVLVAVTLALAVIFGTAFIGAFGADVSACTNKASADSRMGLVLGVIALVGFASGRLLAMVRKWVHQTPAVRDSDVVRTGGWLQGGLAAFLILVAVALGYETYALAHYTSAPPITEYVRCAAATSPVLAALSGFAVSMLLGNWLWYPTR